MNELSEKEFQKTFGDKMTDITLMEIEEPIDIWNYVEELTKRKAVDQYVFDRQLVELIYRNDQNTYDHVLLPTENKNIFMVIVVDLKKKKIFGHRILNLNEKYRLK